MQDSKFQINLFLDIQEKLMDKILNSRLTHHLETNRHTNYNSASSEVIGVLILL